MRILVMGAGGIGGLFGASLARSGHDVTFVGRGAHLEAIQERGLEVRTEGETFRVQPVQAVRRAAEAGNGYDLALFTVKCYDTEQAARDLAPALGPRTAVLTLQNGVDSVDHLSRILGPERVVAGSAWTTVHVEEPGGLVKLGSMTRATLGEPNGEVTPRVKEVAHALEGAGFAVTVRNDIRTALWEKFAVLSVFAAVSGPSRATAGELRATPEGVNLFRQVLGEAVAVARAGGVDLAGDYEEKMMATFTGLSPTVKPSLTVDYERKRRVELEQLVGTVVRRGRELGVPIPGYTALYAVLKVQALAYGGIAAN